MAIGRVLRGISIRGLWGPGPLFILKPFSTFPFIYFKAPTPPPHAPFKRTTIRVRWGRKTSGPNLSKDRYPQALVGTSLLDTVQDRLEQPSRLQGIQPRQCFACNTSAPAAPLPGRRDCRPAGIQGRSLFVSDYDGRGDITAFRHGF